jgi:predicted NAD/FAD-binding protein
MKVAVIGTDVSGTVAAHILSRKHGVVVFKHGTQLSLQLTAVHL